MLVALTPDTAAASLRINYSQPAKPVINLAELAEVLAAVPQAIRRRLPLPVLEVKLYEMAIEKNTLIEEVEAVYHHEATRRQHKPLMQVAR